ncbi:hypothetical protein SAMN02910350_01370 [Pseudobutyrivibrio xylanivorans]|uniref:Uncharacterized protein n=1 Tax=Pseudobutyrivibrio xylanivorans TaxID=185007 RepID=A0A1G5RWZ9_PSEXY|nr:hypothetical protein SAMN02910350_01370 [Pseudobutyrivibrio xylanivorans]
MEKNRVNSLELLNKYRMELMGVAALCIFSIGNIWDLNVLREK